MMAYNGPNRRSEDVRLSLLEKSAQDSEKRHIENKTSLVSVHKRITEVGDKLEDSMVRGLAEIVKKMEEHEAVRATICQIHIDKVTKVENSLSWLDRWAMCMSAAILSLGGWIFHHGSKAR